MDDLALLRLQIEWGADEALEADPVDRLRVPATVTLLARPSTPLGTTMSTPLGAGPPDRPPRASLAAVPPRPTPASPMFTWQTIRRSLAWSIRSRSRCGALRWTGPTTPVVAL